MEINSRTCVKTSRSLHISITRFYIWLFLFLSVFGWAISTSLDFNLQVVLRIAVSSSLLIFYFVIRTNRQILLLVLVLQFVFLAFASVKESALLQIYDFMLLVLIFLYIDFQQNFRWLYRFLFAVFVSLIVELIISISLDLHYSFDGNGRFYSIFIQSTTIVSVLLLFFSCMSLQIEFRKFWTVYLPCIAFIFIYVGERTYLMSYGVFVLSMLLFYFIMPFLNRHKFYIIVLIPVLYYFLHLPNYLEFFQSGYLDSLLVRYYIWLKGFFLFGSFDVFTILADYTLVLPYVDISGYDDSFLSAMLTDSQKELVGWAKRPFIDSGMEAVSAHNFFLQLLLEFGYFGGILSLLSLYFIFFRAPCRSPEHRFLHFITSISFLLPLLTLAWHNHYYLLFLLSVLRSTDQVGCCRKYTAVCH